MSRHSFGSKFLQETSIIVILIFFLNFPALGMSLICPYLISIFNHLLALEKFLLKRVWEINEIY